MVRETEASVRRGLEDLCQMQTELKRELAGLRTELSNQVRGGGGSQDPRSNSYGPVNHAFFYGFSILSPPQAPGLIIR